MKTVLIVGKGEIGSAVGAVLSRVCDVHYVDIDPNKSDGGVKSPDYMHICFGYTNSSKFTANVLAYVKEFTPKVLVIDSTIPVGTTTKLSEELGMPVVHSPVRGRHFDMKRQVCIFKKFVGCSDRLVGEDVADHFWSAGMPSMYLGRPEITEMGKILETTYYGAVLALHQEYSLICDELGLDIVLVHNIWNDDANYGTNRLDGCDHLSKPTLNPRAIHGHCVIPNLDLFEKSIKKRSPLISFIKEIGEQWSKRTK
jgi:hypothetical protein